MFKKFFLVLTLCLGIFGSMAFAFDTSTLPDDGKSYYFTYTSSKDGNIYLYTFNTVAYDVDPNFPNSVINLPDSKHYKWNGSSFVYIDDTNLFLTSSTFINFDTDNIYVYNAIVDNNRYSGELPVPPSITPILEVTVPQVTQDFSAQLLKLLPVGVTILSLVLAIPLLKRLVRSFL